MLKSYAKYKPGTVFKSAEDGTEYVAVSHPFPDLWMGNGRPNSEFQQIWAVRTMQAASEATKPEPELIYIGNARHLTRWGGFKVDLAMIIISLALIWGVSTLFKWLWSLR